MEHLALEVFDLAEGKTSVTALGSKFANLPPNASITITDTSEIFASGDVWSFPFTLNVAANAHLFGTSGEIHGSRLHEQINKRRARLWVMGVPLYLGYLKLGDEVEVDGNGDVDVTFESGQKTFDEMIEGAKANQVPMMSDVRFGVALWRKRWACVNLQLEASAVFSDNRTSTSKVITHQVVPSEVGDEDARLTAFQYDGEDEGNSVQQYPRMVFPKGKFWNYKTGDENDEINCLNTDYPYDDAHPYCNVALCYQKQGYTVTKEEGGKRTTYDDYSSEPTAQRGYEVMPANRVNSAPNFFVIYWLRCLMKHLGIYIDENQMMDVEDLRRLFFVNTNCAYKEVKVLRGSTYDGSLGKYRFGSAGNLLAEYFGDLTDEAYAETIQRYNGIRQITKVENCSFECIDFTAGRWTERQTDYVMDVPVSTDVDVTSRIPAINRIEIKVTNIAGMSPAVKGEYEKRNLFLHDAIATSECFPNVDISETIQAIESGFGVRFLFDGNYQRVRIVLLRNIFRSTEVQEIACEVVSETKTENSIRGFRMTYGESEDTHFYYKGFDDKLPKKPPYFVDDSDKHDYSFWNLDADYADLLNKVTAFDKTCYVDRKTGNAYIIKVDKDAKRLDDLHPSLFEGAGFMDAEDGDCTGEEATIHTVTVGFKPAIMNDVNYENERNVKSTDKSQHFALFVDKTMRARRPDLKDLPNDAAQPGVSSYDDSDAAYNVDKLFSLYGPNGLSANMACDGVVVPGSFAIASDMYAEKKGLSTELEFDYSAKYDWEHQQYVHNVAKCKISDIHIAGHINEGYRLYLQDNFEPNDDGISPVETNDWGLTLGIMRGSGSDARVEYSSDPDDGEGNDTWDIAPGSNATAHPDTCDNYGKEWKYTNEQRVTSGDAAIQKLSDEFPDSNAPFYTAERGYVNGAALYSVKIAGKKCLALFVASYSISGSTMAYASTIQSYFKKMSGATVEEVMNLDKTSNGGRGVIVEINSSTERASTLRQLCDLAYGTGANDIVISNGVSSSYGRFSLKLRAEKLNPYYVADSSDPDKKDQYLPINRQDGTRNPNLSGRGLCDQFYKEYSYWIRNARIVKRTVRMELAQLLTIDKTKRVTVGDVTGFIRKMQFSVDNQSGLGNVTMEIMYI